VASEFPREQLFDEDYLYFYESLLTDELSDRQAEAIWRLLELDRGMEVLDLACGHGRIANRLAERGARVTGLDATTLFLDLARREAQERGIDVEYVEGDMRSLPWESRFDAVVNWFTSFGYFEDDENRAVLHEVHRVLKPGGRLGIENNNLAFILENFRPESVTERDGDLMIDKTRFEPATSRMETERIVVKGGRTRRIRLSVRAFMATELRTWLQDAGFADASTYGRNGEPFSLESPRMITIGEK
jgi:ubiquinone/menaquinone biosynthesis C-methylase UbiE